MRRKRRELLSLVLIGMCSFGAIRAGAQVEGADGDSAGAFTRRDADAADRVQSVGRVEGRLITLDLHQITMKDALRAVARQAKVPLIYNDSDLPADRARPMYGLLGNMVEKCLAHPSVIEFPMNTTRLSAGAGGLRAAFSARYRPR